VSLYFLLTMVVFSMGLAALFATCQVYFRDTSSFLPYFLRLWMYLSPVLWLPEMLDRMGSGLRFPGRAEPDVPDAHRVRPPAAGPVVPAPVDVDRRRGLGHRHGRRRFPVLHLEGA
jgi:hypothetical protein